METNEQRLSTTQTPTTITQHSKEIADQNRSFYASSSLSYRTDCQVLMRSVSNSLPPDGPWSITMIGPAPPRSVTSLI
ncbi:hypothetical protein T03_16280 [Trichinella britovi]|uniref:Uncharacterized protein n=1 Tax=Trichinella britovi TaxID=45882 RepID=A0A0V1D0F5_TRIBR|nr:hypothetical protein T03_16280 [Trichinella britovi]